MELPDARLVERVVAGDVDAYAVLVARYRDRLARYAVRMLGDRHEAEEALQDTFVRGYRALARCENPERFDAWLFSILVNRCRTRGARVARRGRTFVVDNEAMLRAPSPRDGALDAAERGAWRVSEGALLRWAWLGGTLGAYAGRRAFRHKTRKQPFCARLHTIAAAQVLAGVGMVGWAVYR